jgi:hypothetical protein
LTGAAAADGPAPRGSLQTDGRILPRYAGQACFAPSRVDRDTDGTFKSSAVHENPNVQCKVARIRTIHRKSRQATASFSEERRLKLAGQSTARALRGLYDLSAPRGIPPCVHLHTECVSLCPSSCPNGRAIATKNIRPVPKTRARSRNTACLFLTTRAIYRPELSHPGADQ